MHIVYILTKVNPPMHNTICIKITKFTNKKQEFELSLLGKITSTYIRLKSDYPNFHTDFNLKQQKS